MGKACQTQAFLGVVHLWIRSVQHSVSSATILLVFIVS